VRRLGLRSLSAKSFAQRVTRDTPVWVAMPKYAFAYTAVMIAPRLPQELSPSDGHNIFTSPAFATIVTGFISSILLWPRIKRWHKNYKKELNRLKAEEKPGNKKSGDEVALIIFLSLLATGCFCCLCTQSCKSDAKSSGQNSVDSISCSNDSSSGSSSDTNCG